MKENFMNIVVTKDLAGSFTVVIICHDKCQNTQEVQKEIRRGGGEEEVVAFIQFSKDDDLGRLISACCAFSDGLEGSLQYAIEDLLKKFFQFGYDCGLKTTKENCLQETLDYSKKISVGFVTDSKGDLLFDRDSEEMKKRLASNK